MISFDTNVLVYATAALADDRVSRAQDLLARAMRATTSILLLQSLAEFSNVAIRRGRIPANAVKMMIEAWLAVHEPNLIRQGTRGHGAPFAAAAGAWRPQNLLTAEATLP